MTTKHNFLHAYSIVRYDPAIPAAKIANRITVKKIAFDPVYAEAEVKRLNELNGPRGAHYFFQTTRIEQPFAINQPVESSIAVDSRD